MDSQAVLVHLVRKHTESFIRAAECLPADKLGFKAGPGNRTPLGILQEVATIAWNTPQIIAERKMTWTPKQMLAQQAGRAALSDPDEIIARIRACTDMIVETINATDPAAFDSPVEMPFPVDYRVLDILTYHMWNLAYHEGQINYILMAMGVATPFDRK